MLINETFLTAAGLWQQQLLPPTTTLQKLLSKRRTTVHTLWFLHNWWNNTSSLVKQIISRGIQQHGFHAKTCRQKKFHIRNADGIYKLCGDNFDWHHILKCTAQNQSLNDVCRESQTFTFVCIFIINFCTHERNADSPHNHAFNWYCWYYTNNKRKL